ncbi:glycosyltransferase [uncultured Thiodictyon sp.]|uniref:glycosyltransferase family 2 protein n=1 Tax=uncultured Thiodictyon sp. TaxID=1846217 RepID=UPI003459EB18
MRSPTCGAARSACNGGRSWLTPSRRGPRDLGQCPRPQATGSRQRRGRAGSLGSEQRGKPGYGGNRGTPPICHPAIIRRACIFNERGRASMPLISIVTPCYNAECYIQDTIDSVCAQTEGNWEWIITDDRSTDRSVEMNAGTVWREGRREPSLPRSA